MTAQAEFFCTANEERRVFEYLLDSGDVRVFHNAVVKPRKLEFIGIDDIPEWPAPIELGVWLAEAGKLRWHRKRPALDDRASHRRLVSTFIDRMTWDAVSPRRGHAFIDDERSPVMIYRREVFDDDWIGPTLLLSPASNMNRVSEAYARWATRCLRWVRRQGTIVHDYRNPSKRIINELSLLNTIYAMPEAHEALRSGVHRFVVFKHKRER